MPISLSRAVADLSVCSDRFAGTIRQGAGLRRPIPRRAHPLWDFGHSGGRFAERWCSRGLERNRFPAARNGLLHASDGFLLPWSGRRRQARPVDAGGWRLQIMIGRGCVLPDGGRVASEASRNAAWGISWTTVGGRVRPPGQRGSRVRPCAVRQRANHWMHGIGVCSKSCQPQQAFRCPTMRIGPPPALCLLVPVCIFSNPAFTPSPRARFQGRLL